LPHCVVTKVFRYQETFDADNTGNPALEAAKGQLFRDFKNYLLSGHHLASIPVGQFGRDVLYDHPNTLAAVRLAGLRHVHVLPVSVIERVKSSSKFRATSDVHIVYCIDELSGRACALALVEPAHEIARDSQFLSRLAAVAEQFYRS
jgi:mRNA interferase YafO